MYFLIRSHIIIKIGYLNIEIESWTKHEPIAQIRTINNNPFHLISTMFNSLPSINLKSIKKYTTIDGNITARVKSIEDTLNKIIPICKNIGITRISDITYMDRLYIPNYCTILPNTEDSIWVYGGKGITKKHAKTSALMESIERYSSLQKYLFQRFYSRNLFRSIKVS